MSKTVRCPFTVLIDSAEQQPFGFENIKSDARYGGKPLIINTRWQCLGRHPNSLGDYSASGLIGIAHVERKSIQDCQHTILDFSGGRDRFKQELTNLSQISAGMVVVEGSLKAVLATRNPRRARPHKVVAKQLLRSIIAFQQDYHVPWMFCDSRAFAEVVTFRFLERAWRKQQESDRLLARL